MIRLLSPKHLAVAGALILCSAARPAVAEEPNRSAQPDSNGTRRESATQAAEQDTSMLTGNGLNTTKGPFFKPAAGGAMRKDPGSRSWTFVKALSNEEMKLEHERHLQELVAKFGNEPRDIVIELKDTTDVGKLRAFKIEPPAAPPCTLQVRVLYRQLPELKKAGLKFWGKGDPRPGTGEDKLKGRPERPRGRPPTRTSSSVLPLVQPDGLLSTQAVSFSEGFESNAVPGTYWAADDYTNVSPTFKDFWGDLSSSNAYVHSGGWSISCSAHGDRPFFSYDNDQDSYALNQTPAYINMSTYSSYTLSFWLRLETETGHDYFRTYYNAGGGWIQLYANAANTSGWTQLQFSFPNSGHLYDQIAMTFKFESDLSGIVGSGAYVDDILIDGTQSLANLTSYTPPGWSGPIVPSSVTGTTTTGTLYAGQPTYIDWAIQNNGAANTSNTFYIDYYLDGSYVGGDTKFGLNAGTGYTRTDWSYTVPTSGNHTLKMIIDPTSAVSESNEGDNVYQQTFFWNPPPPPDLIVLSLVPSSANPTVGQSITATVTIKNQGTGAASGTFYTYFYKNLPVQPIQGQLPYDDIHTTFSLAAGQTDSYTITGLTSPFAIPWTMYAYVDASNAITNESNENNNVSSGVTVNWTAGSVTISGTLAYDDTSYYSPAPRTNNRPMRCVKVYLWEADASIGQPTPDDLLDSTVTNAAGQFTFPQRENRDADTDQGKLDLYVKAPFESQASCLGGNAVVRVLDGTSLTWTYSSTPVTDVPNGSVNLGTLKPLDYNRRTALHLYDTILGGYDWATAQGGSPSGPWLVNVEWQSGVANLTQYDSATNTLSVDGQFSASPGDLRPDEWDDSILLHEYGHKLAAIFVDDDPGMRNQPPHYANSEDSCSTTPGGPPVYPCGNLAWSEGLAHYLSCARRSVRRSTDLDVNAAWTKRDSLVLDLESGAVDTNNVALPNSPVVDKGHTWEMSVAGALWDIFDSNNDNIKNASCGDTFNGGGPLVWDALVNHGAAVIHNASDFWAVICSRNPSVATGLSSVYCAHGMITVGCSGLVAVDPASEPQQLALAIAPNPFRGRATIECVIPTTGEGAHNSLVIYDVAGRTIKRFGGEMLVVGRQRLVWDGRTSDGGAVPTGLYFCHLTTASGGKSAAMLMIR